MAAPATVLLALHEIGGNPISKGAETGFKWRAALSSGQIVLSAEPHGTMNLWVRLRVPITPGKVTASTEQTPLFVKQMPDIGNTEWLEITKSATEDYFDWHSGRTIILQFNPPSTQLAVVDWQALLSTKGESDSKDWAERRKWLFHIGIGLLFVSLLGGILEALEKYGAKSREATPLVFTSQRCVEQMIDGFEGEDEDQSEQSRKFLRKLLLEDATVDEALAPLNLKRWQQFAFLLKIRVQFRHKLVAHLDHLNRLLKRLK